MRVRAVLGRNEPENRTIMPKRQHPNRLIHEKSPYLQQHAWNPVDWYPWGEEAFETARKTERPIFLSVGYSTCHWCHVMEHESFEDETTATLLNNRFVPVKVDREEMPDLDRLYMLFVQATTGSGGWPMSVWLTPSLKPFYGGSYFPPVERWGRPAFRVVLESIDSMWRNDRNRLLDSAGSMMRQLLELTRRSENGAALTSELSERCLKQLADSFDPEYGGFGGAPKFPRPVLLRFLFDHYARTGDHQARHMALLTLEKMEEGGIHDQLGIQGKGGGGFARYSTDEYWHVPHFEKMLYDNAQLADAYLRGWQCTQEPRFAETAKDIFNYVLCDMTSPDGGFYAAEDADSISTDGSNEPREGAFYLWSHEEVMHILGEKEGTLFCQAYAIREKGNAPYDPHGEFTGRNILIRAENMPELAIRAGLDPAETERKLEASRTALFDVRSKRPKPRRDEKVITAWNGLMISALARGAGMLQQPELLQAAERAVDFILDKLCNRGSWKLLRSWCDGEASIPGKAIDYACLIQALIDLYEASFNPEYLRMALRFTESQIGLFYDHSEGGFFSTPMDDALIPLRLKEDEDGAEPSANSVSVMNLLRLAAMTGREEFRELALTTLQHFAGTMERVPSAVPLLIASNEMALHPVTQVVLAGDPNDSRMKALRDTICRHDHFNLVLMQSGGSTADLLPEADAIGKGYDGPPAALVCYEGSCKPPVHDPETLMKILKPE